MTNRRTLNTVFFIFCCIFFAVGCTHKKSKSSAKKPKTSASAPVQEHASQHYIPKNAYLRFTVRGHTYGCIEDPSENEVGSFRKRGSYLTIHCGTSGDKRAYGTFNFQAVMESKLKPARFEFTNIKKFTPCLSLSKPTRCIGKATAYTITPISHRGDKHSLRADTGTLVIAHVNKIYDHHGHYLDELGISGHFSFDDTKNHEHVTGTFKNAIIVIVL